MCCGKIKLFKLLYLMDFEHFRETGKSVTGLDYQAWKFGPVPVQLATEWEEPEPELAMAIHISYERVIDFTRECVIVNDGVEFSDLSFTPRQLRIMESLATKYRETLSHKMIDVTHAQNGAWDKVWQGGIGASRTIPYELAIPEDAAHREEFLAISNEQKMRRAAQSLCMEG
ncbi:Panacea domain-containing protein [Paraperlucidibaca sp.]|uniref:Panacea domain-containing protein n=1 Tax=Paraperlucidibaca sp. TaxID=2708021 RepID=UPI0030F4A565